MIQARKPIFNIHYGKFIKPLEKKVTKHGRFRDHFGKGSPDEIANRISKLSLKWQYKTEGDHTTFDAHITKELLELTHKYYAACYNNNAELKRLSKRTIINKCRSRHGDKYTVEGSRMSGDVDTSFGNSIINIAILSELMYRLGINGEYIVNGDDFILFTNKPVNIRMAEAILRTMNMETKMKESTENIHNVEFCQTKLVLTAEGRYTTMKHIRKTVEKFGMTFVTTRNYWIYVLENAHGMWMMNKTTPLGLLFKHIYFKMIELNMVPHAQELITKHRKLEYEYLEKAFIYFIKLSRKDTAMNEDYQETTVSMITADEDIMDLTEIEQHLMSRIIKLYKQYPQLSTKQLLSMPYNRNLFIDHNTKTKPYFIDN